MDDDAAGEMEILLLALTANIEAYRQAALQVRQYRWYALCRHQESERRRLHDLLAEQLPVAPRPVPLRSSIWLRLHRLATWFRLAGRTDKSLLRDLRREDMLLLKLTAAFLEEHDPEPGCAAHLKALVQTVIRADNEIAHIVRRKASRLATGLAGTAAVRPVMANAAALR